jgi:hypothetical protein
MFNVVYTIVQKHKENIFSSLMPLYKFIKKWNNNSKIIVLVKINNTHVEFVGIIFYIL